ncbi:MAG: hypothetical protein WCX26_04995, partial [Saccharofermentanales bacterium]
AYIFFATGMENDRIATYIRVPLLSCAIIVNKGCAQSKRNKREQGYRVHFVLNSCPSPYKNANFDTIRIGVSVFYLNTTAAKKYTTCNLSGADRESHYN